MKINHIAPTKLSNVELKLLHQLLLMTGREDRLGRDPVVPREQIPGIHAICPKLRNAARKLLPSDARCELLNRLLLSLSIMTISQEFFDTVFKDVDFADFAAIATQVKKFRIVCMLEYGNFRFGYKQLRRDDLLIKKTWSTYFPSELEVKQREDRIRSRPEPELIHIDPSELFALGNLESEQVESINSAREALHAVLTTALKKGVVDFETLRQVAILKGLPLTSLIARAGLPRAEELIDLQLAHDAGHHSYAEILTDLRRNCRRVHKERIKRIRTYGIQNAKTYMAMHDLDVYVATSMRAPLHFTTNWVFVDTLFHFSQLCDWRLRYFDPTQTYLQSRIQMGLLECLMIKRTQITVYHAHELDTFGKDCEAGVTLAQAKPVVVYVTRLFDRHPAMHSLYGLFDQAARRIHRDDFVGCLRERGLLDKADVDSLLSDSEKSKADAIEMVVKKRVDGILRKLEPEQLEMELIRQGYAPPEKDLISFTLSRIMKLERRALTFRDVHPLALQASPMDGVARGVIVTRTIADTAKVVAGLLNKTLSFEIIDDKENWLLVDSVTRSPVRVVTKDSVLTSAFWSESWGNKS